jgi:hypothetical protein
MSELEAILALAKALPELLQLGKDFLIFLNRVSGNDPQGYVKKVGAAMTALNAAQTQEERTNAASLIADAISGL